MSDREEAQEKIIREMKEITDPKAKFMAPYVRDALLEFCRQDEEFARAVVQGGHFADCMAAVSKGVTSALSDLEAYRRAVSFYFPGAEIRMSMKIDLCGSVQGAPHPDGPALLLDLSDFF